VDISIGCHFTFGVPTTTHAVVLAEPHVAARSRLVGGHSAIDAAVAAVDPADPALPMTRCRDRRGRWMTFRTPGGVGLVATTVAAGEVG
jgi:hypothetical protein